MPLVPVRDDGAAPSPHPEVAYAGNPDRHHQPLLALFCSRACPGSVILRANDLAVALPDEFQTPMECELPPEQQHVQQPVAIAETRSPTEGVAAGRASGRTGFRGAMDSVRYCAAQIECNANGRGARYGSDT